MRTLIIVLVTLLPGCASLLPDSMPVEISHDSHLMQHFREHPQSHGYSTFFVGLKWKRGDFSIKLEEGYAPKCLDDQHEVFQGSIEYDIPLR